MNKTVIIALALWPLVAAGQTPTPVPIPGGPLGGTITGGTISGTNVSGANVTATGATTARTLAAQAADRLDVKAYGAKGDAIVFDASEAAGAGISVASGSKAAYSSAATWTAADVSKAITIDGAGVAGGPLVTTIAGFSDGHNITLQDAAGTTVPTQYISNCLPATAQAGAGSYAPGDTATLAGGTGTAASCRVAATTVVAVAANGAGSGGVDGACVLTGTTGVGASGLGLFSANATISGGAITAVGSIVNAGIYTTNPTSLAAEPVTGCSLVGGTLALTMGVKYANVATPGAYTTMPTNPVAQASSTGSGTGATFTAWWNTSGDFVYGTDDNVAIAAAITDLNTNYQAKGHPVAIYFPGGVYLVRGPALPVFTGTAGLLGDGKFRSIVRIDTPYSGDVFSWSNTMNNSGEYNGNVQGTADQAMGPEIANLGVYGDRSGPNVQHAFSFYNRVSDLRMHDVAVYYVPGSAVRAGVSVGGAKSYIRESSFDNLKFNSDGSPGYPVFDLQYAVAAGDATWINTMDIYSPFDVGFRVLGGAFRAENLRVEGLEYNSANIQADLIQLGGSVAGQGIGGSTILNSYAVDPYLGYAAVHVMPGNYGSTGYTNDFNFLLGGGAAYGRGLWISGGRNNTYNIINISDIDYGIVIDSSTYVGVGNIINTYGFASTYKWLIDPTSINSFSAPVRSLGSPALTAALGVSGDATNFVAGTTNLALSLPVGGNNTLIGSGAGRAVTGIGVTAVGSGALGSSVAAANNTAMGVVALELATGGNNTAMGAYAGFHITTGTSNTAVGSSSIGGASVTGSYNTAVGTDAGTSITGAALGNVSVGFLSCGGLTTGSYNICLGYETGQTNNTTGSGNILLGKNIDVKSAGASNYLNIGGLLIGDISKGHTAFGGPALTTSNLSSCGSTGLAVATSSTDHVGYVTAGAGATTCTLTFANAWSSTPSCTVSSRTGLPLTYTPATNTLIVSNAALGGTAFDYRCDALGTAAP
jgi:hypothetical protein